MMVLLAAHHQKLNFSLLDGEEIWLCSCEVNHNDELNEAQIKRKAGASPLTPGQRYNFTLVVNEFDNAPDNSEEMLISVIAVTDNVAPVFITGQPTAAMVEERSVEETIATFTGRDANNQAVTFSIRVKAVVADDDAEEAERLHIIDVNNNAVAVLGAFDIDGFQTTGILKTKTKRDKGTDDDQPDFNEDPVDDPDTANIDESDPDHPPVNTYVYLVRLYDGTLYSTDHEFTLTVTDAEDPLPGSEQVLNIEESDEGGEDNGLEPAVSIRLV